MKIDKAISELRRLYNCPVLEGHFRNILGKLFIEDDDVSFAQFTQNSILPALLGVDYRFYNDQSRADIASLSKLPVSLHENIFQALEQIGRLYIFYSIMPTASKLMTEELDRLRVISETAMKLKSLLPKADDPLLILLQVISLMETESLEKDPVGDFLNQMNYGLDELINLPSNIPDSKAAKFLKIGTKSPKGNMNLHVWIEALFQIWSELLERNFEYDGTQGVSGRNRFTDFAFEALLPIHESITHSRVKYAVRMFADKVKTGSALLPHKITS